MQTPQAAANLPGLPAIAYRTGTWAAFKESMLARLSSADYPALSRLKTREDDDFSIALLDATSVVLDILTFYQERLANESYLRTATQLRSLTELSRLIGYQPAPGVSASTYLAFTLKTTPGQPPNPSAAPITIPQGTQIQSVPVQGQTPQTFETSADIQAQPDWNALPLLTSQPWLPNTGDTFVYLGGTATQLNPGDMILVVGEERVGHPADTHWDVRVVLTVEADTANNRTRITWNEGLGGTSAAPARQAAKVYAFRQRASLFGYNAIDPNLLNTSNTSITHQLGWDSASPPNYWWNGFQMSGAIDLDATYPKIVQNGWVVLVLPEDYNKDRSLSGFVTLYQVSAISSVSRTAFGLSAKISRIIPDTTTPLGDYDLRTTLALVQSEELATAPQPLTYPLYGTVLDLADLRPDLAGVQVVAVSGTRQKIAVTEAGAGLTFVPDDSSEQSTPLSPGDVLTLTEGQPLLAEPFPAPDATTGQIPPWSYNNTATITSLNVEDVNGRTGTVQNVSLDQFVLAAPGAKEPAVSEYALVSSTGPVNEPYPHTQIRLTNPLAYCYDRATTAVNANAGPATHGQSVSEIMGSGSASTPNQSFTLKQSPLTFVQAATPSGRQSTLQVQVNAAAWSEAPSLYHQGPASAVFATLNQEDGTTDVIFGDGVEGALLPTGQNNVQAKYRIGSGSAGNVGGGALSTLLDRPLGVSGVTNPQAATGGQDAEPADDIRANAPLTVLTLGRAVSITDYQNYAGAFAGIAKASAIWIPSGPGRGVFLTVAGVHGAALPAGSNTLASLLSSLQNYGHPLVPITIVSYMETLFAFSANLQYDPGHDQPTVQTQAFQAVTAAFSFEARSFGQCVSADEITAVIQAVPGVVAVNVTGLWRTASSTGGDISSQVGRTVSRLKLWLAAKINPPGLFLRSSPRLCAYLPVANAQSLPSPAEILVLDPGLTAAACLGVMS